MSDTKTRLAAELRKIADIASPQNIAMMDAMGIGPDRSKDQ